jgi:pimeloyl-ACP methyl ester carboxylesterase
MLLLAQVALADHLDLKFYAAVGYSQGAIECAKLLTVDKRICCGVIGGQGDSICDGDWLQSYGINTLAVALEQRANGMPVDAKRTDRMRSEGLADPDNFVMNILAGGGSLLCMANVQRGQSVTSPEELATIGCPVMCLTGDQDFTGGDNAKLASYIPKGHVVYIEGHDHSSAVAAPEFSAELLKFLREHLPAPSL